jgi:hypothetical protein
MSCGAKEFLGVSRVNLDQGRMDPNFSSNLAMGAELYRKELRTLQFQLQATNVTERLKVINFASLFSGTAVGAPRMFSARLRLTLRAYLKKAGTASVMPQSSPKERVLAPGVRDCPAENEFSRSCCMTPIRLNGINELAWLCHRL